MNIKEIELYFENCDSCLIEYDNIKTIYIGDIVENYRFSKRPTIKLIDKEIKSDSRIRKGRECKQLFLQLFDFWNLKTRFNQLLLTKVNDQDIVSFKMIFEDDTFDELDVIWCEDGKNYQANKYQTSGIENDKYLNIIIENNKEE